MKSKNQIKYFNWLARFRQETKRFAQQKVTVGFHGYSVKNDKDYKSWPTIFDSRRSRADFKGVSVAGIHSGTG